jgi:hypothetical protein
MADLICDLKSEGVSSLERVLTPEDQVVNKIKRITREPSLLCSKLTAENKAKLSYRLYNGFISAVAADGFGVHLQ